MTFNQLALTSGRRTFLKRLSAAGVLTIVGTGGTLLRNPMTAWALPGNGNDTVIVSLFLRGAADGLDIVVPHGDSGYYDQRGTFARTSADYADLDGFFGLSNDFSDLLPYFNDGRAAFVQAVGSHLPTRSHFVAQPNMESGLGIGGWMQRAIATSGFTGTPGLSIGSRTSPQLQGPFSGATINTVDDTIQAGVNLQTIRPAITALYQGSAALALEADSVAGELATIDAISGINPMPGPYPETDEAGDFREAATLIKSDIGVRAVAIDSRDWDHHADQKSRITDRGGKISAAIDSFMQDLGADASRVIVVVSSEFGRTVRPNGSAGTDHGHGNMMMVVGDPLIGQGGGKVLTPGGWPGLADGQLYLNRDLEVTTDFRSVYAELVQRHLGLSDTTSVFPGFVPEPVGLLNARGDFDGSGAVDSDDVQAVLEASVGDAPLIPGDINNDGYVDLVDALLLAQQVGGN